MFQRHAHAGKLIAFSELMKPIFGIASLEIVQKVSQNMQKEQIHFRLEPNVRKRISEK
jgi:hypothetical protein